MDTKPIVTEGAHREINNREADANEANEYVYPTGQVFDRLNNFDGMAALIKNVEHYEKMYGETPLAIPPRLLTAEKATMVDKNDQRSTEVK